MTQTHKIILDNIGIRLKRQRLKVLKEQNKLIELEILSMEAERELR